MNNKTTVDNNTKQNANGMLKERPASASYGCAPG